MNSDELVSGMCSMIHTEYKLEETYPDELPNVGGSDERQRMEDAIAAGGSLVAKGRHVVPKGVAVEELQNYGGEKNLFDVYDQMVDAIYKDKNTRGFWSKWKDAEFVGVLDLFHDDFAEKGVNVALCKRKSGSGTYRWLEFIDMEELGHNYVPQYDVSNRSGQVIKTVYSKLEFPNGVAVEEFKEWNGRQELKEETATHVEKMLQEHNLLAEYNQLIDHCIEAGIDRKMKNWNTRKLLQIQQTYRPIFATKGVDLFVGHKVEYVSHGQYGGHNVHFRWIEFGKNGVLLLVVRYDNVCGCS
jgi:hypothetical protein